MSGYLGLLEEEKVLVLDDLAVAEKISLSYVSRIFRLANQSTKIVQAILEGKTAGMVLNEKQPLEWNAQERVVLKHIK